MKTTSPFLILILIIGVWNVSARDEPENPQVGHFYPMMRETEAQVVTQLPEVDEERPPQGSIEVLVEENGQIYRHVHCSYNCPNNEDTLPSESSCTIKSLRNKRKKNNRDVEVSAPVPLNCTNEIVEYREDGRSVNSAFARANFIFPRTERNGLDKFFVTFYDHGMFPFEYQVKLGEDVHYWEYDVKVTVDSCDFYIEAESPFMMDVASSPYKEKINDAESCSYFQHTGSCCDDPLLLSIHPCTELDCSQEGLSLNDTVSTSPKEELRDLMEMVLEMQVENAYTKAKIGQLENEIEIMKNRRQQMYYDNDIIIKNLDESEQETEKSLQRRIIKLFKSVDVEGVSREHLSLCMRLEHDSNGDVITDRPRPVLVRFALRRHKVAVMDHKVDFHDLGILVHNRVTAATEELKSAALAFLRTHPEFRSFKRYNGDLYLVRAQTGELVLVETLADLEALN